MDIHRSRFVAYPTSAINALAFSHSTTLELGLDNISSLRLAVGRANGDIEIWNPASGSWIRETTFYGGKNRSVEGLTWTQEPDELDEEGNVLTGALRLFSIGCSNTVTEWNLESGLPLRHWSGNHSEVWCLAAQPRVERLQGKDLRKQIRQQGNFRGQDLVAGCADGTIVVLSTADNEITFQRFLSRPTAKKAKALSVTFKDRVKVVAGYADSTIRVFDLRNGNLIRNISLGAGPVGGPKETLVWAVKCLPNGDIVSGDSTGEVRFFEGRNYSQVQRISGHDADILSLVVSKDGNYVYSAGMDRRTILYTRASGGSAQGRWAKSSHSSYHEHDVKAMATFESSKLSIIASGGLFLPSSLATIR
jgi:U3 small nucleolar RNA-associated protein 4